MRRLAKIVGAFALFGAVTAIAAPDATSPVAPAPPSNPAPNTPAPMSAGDMNVSVASIEAQIETDSSDILHLQEIAKKQKDVIKLNCVNDRLVQFKAVRNIVDETHVQLTAAIQKNSDDRQGLYTQFVSQSETIKDLHEQAKSCIGTPDMYKQESGVTVDRPTIIDDPTVIQPTDNQVEPPAYASPYD